MEAATVKIEPQDIKTEPQDSGSPKKKKPPGRPKKLKQEKITDHVVVKKKKHDRFKGMSEEEVQARLLPDHLAPNLDIVIVGINPGLFAAFIGHHYAGPGNHFWKCMYLSGLIPEPMNAMQDFKLLDYGIGFTNIVARTTKGSADLTRKEIKEGAVLLTEKLLNYKPKIAVFNGKGIYEVFVGHKNFYFGKQPEPLPGTQTAVFVMPSSSARCSQLPRAVDKVPFYEALKKFRDHLNGKLPNLDDSEICFPDLELKTAKKEVKQEIKEEVKQEGYEEMTQQDMEAQIDQAAGSLLSQFTQGNYQIIPHSSSSDLPNLPNMNGLSVPHIKQEPQDLENVSVPKAKKGRSPRKKKKSLESSPANSSQSLDSSVSVKQEPPDSVSSACSLPPVSVSQPPSQMTAPIQIKQEPQDDFVSMPECSSASISQSPSQSNGEQCKQQEPQTCTLPGMPPLQQYPKVKQEPKDTWEPSCVGNSQSDAPSYPKYLNLDQSEPMFQNGNSVGNNSNSFLQGMYGMVSKVASQQQSNYGMVNLPMGNQTMSAGNGPLQFNDALCGIVKDSSYDLERYDSIVIKTEPEVEKKPKPKTRKRKSNSKPASTITSPMEDNEQSSAAGSSPGSSLQGYHPVTANETYPQNSLQLPHSSQPKTMESYPQLSHNIPHSHSHNSISRPQSQSHDPHRSLQNQSHDPHRSPHGQSHDLHSSPHNQRDSPHINPHSQIHNPHTSPHNQNHNPQNSPHNQSHSPHNMYSHQNYPPYPPLYPSNHVNGNYFHHSGHLSQPTSFSQMLAQEPDVFRMNQYSKDFNQTHGAMPNMDPRMPGHGYPYGVPGYERWGYPPVPSAANDSRMSTNAVSSQATQDSAVDLTQAVNNSGPNLEAKTVEESTNNTDSHHKMDVNQERSEN